MISSLCNAVRMSGAIACSIFIFLTLSAVNFSPADCSTSEYLANISLRFYMGETVDDQYFDVLASDSARLMDKLILDNRTTILYVHGYNQNLEEESVHTVLNAYLKRQDHNVLATDWSKIASQNYVFVTASASEVGKVLAEALNDLVAHSLNPSTLHVIGHSLGGQISGYIGRNVDFKLPRITGLDPAGPGFYIVVDHLTASDAEFVDVIHTDSGVYGYALSSGDAEFFPNGGQRIQPGCPFFYLLGDDNDFCSHRRSWMYYAESVANEEAFIGVQCDDNWKFASNRCKNNEKVPMGIATPSDTKGTFYLNTKRQPPFGRGKDGVNPIIYNN